MILPLREEGEKGGGKVCDQMAKIVSAIRVSRNWNLIFYTLALLEISIANCSVA